MRNKYIGKWEERGWKEIELAFIPENLKFLLRQGINESIYTHQDIASWCMNYAKAQRDGDEALDKAYDVADDVDAQWDLFLSNTYTLQELQSLDFSKVKLPKEWFERWLSQLV